jgi:hypothetical protein
MVALLFLPEKCLTRRDRQRQFKRGIHSEGTFVHPAEGN